MTADTNSGGSFIRELKRRRVLRACIYYAIVCGIILFVGGMVFPALGLDEDAASRVLSIVAVLGFPVIFLFAWYFQLSPQGVARTTSFVERRVLRNMLPINDRRHAPVSNDPQLGREDKAFDWIVSAVTGPLTGLSYGIIDPVNLGCAVDCEIAIVSSHVSQRHARLELAGDNLVVEDLGSANGTVVNGKPIEGRHVLHHGDELRLHDVIFRVSQSSASSSAE